MTCEAARQAVLLHLYGEIREEEGASAQRHLVECEACRLAVAEERRLHALLADRSDAEPSDRLLQDCRRGLTQALDTEPPSASPLIHRWMQFWSRARLSPAYGLTFLLVGFMAGAISLRATDGRPTGGGIPSADGIGGDQSAGGSDAVTAPVASLRSLEAFPDQDRVRLDYDTVRRDSLEGSAGDPRIRDLLIQTARDSDNPGLRMQAIEALRRHVDQAEVRQALLQTLLVDDNAGARLKAMDALDARVPLDREISDAMLEAVRRDTNPGVRVRAIDMLARAPDARMLGDMERLRRETPDTYVRMRSGDFVDAMHARNAR